MFVATQNLGFWGWKLICYYELDCVISAYCDAISSIFVSAVVCTLH